jgi:uncharacterized membrane protein YphA (DoxX/SURF4 family)
MSMVLLIARVLLAIVFLVAGLAKLADLAGSRQALRDFGVPTRLANLFGILLPLAELALAVALLPTLSAGWAALGALVLLLLFVAGIGYNLARGRQPDCHCFGQLHSAPAGWPTLMRNLGLAAIAGVVVAFGWIMPGPGALDWLTVLPLAQRIEVLVAVVVGALLIGADWLIFQIMAQQGRLLLRLEALETKLAEAGVAAAPTSASVSNTAVGSSAGTAGLSVGTLAPSFALSDISGKTVTLEKLRASHKPVLLLFSDPCCGPCNLLEAPLCRQAQLVGDQSGHTADEPR